MVTNGTYNLLRRCAIHQHQSQNPLRQGVLWYNICVIKVDGILKKEVIGASGIFVYRVEDGTRYFNDLSKALDYAEKVAQKTGIYLCVRT